MRGRSSTLSLKRPEEIFWPYFHRSNSHLSSQSIFQVKFDNDTRKSLHYETKNYLVNLLRVSAIIFYTSFNNPRISLRQNTTTLKRLEYFHERPGLFRLPRPGPEPQPAQTTSCLAQSCCDPEVHVISVTSCCGAHCTKAVHREPHFGPRKYRFPSTFVAKLIVYAQNI